MGKCLAFLVALTVFLAACSGDSFLLSARVFFPRMSRGLYTWWRKTKEKNSEQIATHDNDVVVDDAHKAA